MNKGSISTFLAGAIVGVMLATVGYAFVVSHQNTSGGGVTVLKLGHAVDQQHPVHLAMEHMAEVLAEKSGGTLLLSIAPNGQLGTETECIELVQRGSLALTKTSTAPLESFIPEMAVFGVPYVFRGADHFWGVLEGEIGKELLVAGDDVGVHGLCWYDAGARSFYTKRTPIETPDDLKGLKIRVQNSQTAMQMVEAMGGSPTPMNYGELYTGLQQGMVDGAENNPPSFVSSRHLEVCKEYTLDEHTMVPDLLLISKNWWDRLSPQQQQWLEEAAAESSVVQRELWETRTNECLEAAEAEGVTVRRPDKAPFIERASGLHASYNGTPVGDLMQRILSQE